MNWSPAQVRRFRRRLPEWLLGGALIEPVRTFVTSIFIVAGPWILSVLALAIISASLEPVMGRAATEDLRLTIIYSLCIAPIAAGPIGTVAARLIRAVIDREEPELVPEVVLSSLCLAGAAAFVMAGLLCGVLGIPSSEMALAFIFLSVVTALLWVCLAVLSALRAFVFLTGAFAAGLAFGLFCAFVSGSTTLEGPRLIWSFTAGLAFCVALVLARLVEGLPRVPGASLDGLRALLTEMRRQKYLALGTVLAMCGVWVDKWVLWAGPDSERSLSGFFHFGTYDSVMFLAHLSIIPTFAAMQILHDGTMTSATRQMRRTLNRRASLPTVRASVKMLGMRVWNGIFVIFFVQATITATLVLIAPIVSQRMHFDFEQFLMLRVGLVAVFLHSMFYVSSAILVLCGRSRLFFVVQLLFFVANALFSLGFLAVIGPSAFGIFTASLIAATVCFVFAYRALQTYDYLMLVGENASLFGET